MKIISNKKEVKAASIEEIRKQRDEYDAETQKYVDRQEAGSANYRNAIRTSAKAIEQQIANKIGSTPLALEISVNDNWEDAWEVRVKANEYNRSDNAALAWNWDVKFNRKGEIEKDSSSWSGLKAITPEQIADLEESVRVIKVLNNIDWYMLLKGSKKPMWDEFQDREANDMVYQRKKNRPNFDEQLKSAQIEQYLGSNTALKLTKDSMYNGTCYILPTAVSDKFVTGYIFPEYFITGTYGHSEPYTADEIRAKIGDVRRTAKSNLATGYDDTTKTSEYIAVLLG